MDSPLHVLIVEDNPSDAELMVRRLKNDGFHLEWVRVDDEEGYLAALDAGCDIILSDWSLPDFSGLRALKIACERNLDTPFIIISGSVGEEAAVDALHQGASDYLLKDRPERLGQAVRNALVQKSLRDQHKQGELELRKTHDFVNNLLNYANGPIIVWDPNLRISRFNHAFEHLTGYSSAEVSGNTLDLLFPPESRKSSLALIEETQGGEQWEGVEIPIINRNGSTRIVLWNSANLHEPGGQNIIATIAQGQDITDRKRAEQLLIETSEDLRIAYDATLQGWSSALELREHETAGHSQRVVHTTLDLARSMGITKEAELVHIQRGALLHDIGKMGIPDTILLKPGPLTQSEWEIMRLHPVYAYKLLSKIPYLLPAMDIPYYHHEHWDGSGYPKGLKGEQIPLAARIFTVVDVWDALSFDRPYRSAWSEEKIIEYLKEMIGKQFDPQVVPKFLNILLTTQSA
jgi:PAS domain S-box-containing protein